jgi:hypothetical protein
MSSARAKSKTASSNKARKPFVAFLQLANVMLSRDMILGKDNSLSAIRLYDRIVRDDSKDAYFPPLCLCVELFRFREVDSTVFNEAELKLKITLKPPQGQELEIGEFPVDKVQKPWIYTRSIFILTDHVGFKSCGDYHFVIYGKSKDSDYEKLGDRLIPVVTRAEAKQYDQNKS